MFDIDTSLGDVMKEALGCESHDDFSAFSINSRSPKLMSSIPLRFSDGVP